MQKIEQRHRQNNYETLGTPFPVNKNMVVL